MSSALGGGFFTTSASPQSHLNIMCCVLSRLVTLVTPRTVAHQAPLSVGILQARILEWLVMPSSRGSSWLRTEPALAGGFFTTEPPGKPVELGFGICVCKSSSDAGLWSLCCERWARSPPLASLLWHSPESISTGSGSLASKAFGHDSGSWANPWDPCEVEEGSLPCSQLHFSALGFPTAFL